MLEKLITYAKDNAISEATFTIYLGSKVKTPEELKPLIYTSLKSTFQEFGVLDRSIRVGGKSIQENVTVAYRLSGFENEKLRWVLQVNQDSETPSISIHCLKYKDWKEFSETVIHTIKEVSLLKEDISAHFFSLSYIDQFNWLDEKLPIMETLFQPNDFLPKSVLNTDALWKFGLVLSNKNNNFGDFEFKYTDKIDITTNQVNPSIFNIGLIHNTMLSYGRVESLKGFLENGKIKNALEFAHKNNKKILRSMLQDEVLEKMGMNKNISHASS